MNNYNNYNNNNKKNNDWVSWAIIGFLLVSGGWPIALPWLFIKLFAPDKKKSERRQAPPLYQQENKNPYSYSQQNGSNNGYYYSAPVNNNEAQPNVSKAASTFRNMTQSPTSGKKSERRLAVGGGILGFIGLAQIITIISEAASFSFFDFSGFLWALAFLLGGGAMIYSAISLKKADQRFAKYTAIIGSNQAIHVATLAKKAGVSEKTVRKDLQKMLDKGLFGPYAYINEELGYFFRSSEADNEIQRAKEAAEKKTEQEIDKQKAAADISQFELLLAQIKDVNARIAHEEMSAKIYHLEDITREIFTTVNNNPEKRSKIDKFLSYYLPTTLKLLDSYSKLEATGLESDNISQSKKTIENAMDNVIGGFEHQLDDLYKSDVVDIETDVDVLTKMLDRDNPSSDFASVVEEDTRTQFEKDFNVKRESDGTITYGGFQAKQ